MPQGNIAFHHLDESGAIRDAMPVERSIKAFRWLDKNGFKTMDQVPGHLISVPNKAEFGERDPDVVVGDCFAVIPAGCKLQVTLPGGDSLYLVNEGSRITSAAPLPRARM